MGNGDQVGWWRRYLIRRRQGPTVTGIMLMVGTAAVLVVVAAAFDLNAHGAWGMAQAAGYGLVIGLALFLGDRIEHRREARRAPDGDVVGGPGEA